MSLPFPASLRGLYQRLLGQFLEPFTANTPAARLIRTSARQQWRLLAVNIGTNFLSSVSEGGTLGVIFLAVSLMTAPNTAHWGQLPILGVVQQIPLIGPLLQSQISSNEGRKLLFALLILSALLLQVLMAVGSYVNSISAALMGNRISTQITGMLHRRVLSLTFACASRFRVGDLLNYIQGAGNTVNSQIGLANGLLVNFVQLLVYLGILVVLSPWLLMVAAAMAVTLGLVQKQVLPRIRHRAEMMTTIGVDLGSKQTEHIQGLRLLHSSGQLANAAEETDGLLQELQHHGNRINLVSNLVGPISGLLPILAIAVIAIFSVTAFQGRQSGILPSLVTFVLALQRMNTRLAGLNNIANGYAGSSAAVARLNKILTDEDKEFVRTGGLPFRELQRDIRLERVGLRYSSELAPALSGIDLVIPKGSTVALVGPSGAGKSSIADLLVGLYDPSEGRILIDGVDLQQLELASWQQKLGVVSQDTFLFNATIAANIAFGCPWATREMVENAAITAQAAGFIQGLPDGYDTLIGERGYRLSGGQRQRLSLARAILRKPQLLILDEATSALDSQSERLVQEAIERFERQHTVLVIAHRLSTIVNADQICVMDAGRIIERGNHDALLAAGGTYTSLWRQQSEARKRTPVA